MNKKLIAIAWMFMFCIPTILTIYLINTIEWFVLVPFQFISTVMLVLLFFRYVKWRNKKLKEVKYNE